MKCIPRMVGTQFIRTAVEGSIGLSFALGVSLLAAGTANADPVDAPDRIPGAEDIQPARSISYDTLASLFEYESRGAIQKSASFIDDCAPKGSRCSSFKLAYAPLPIWMPTGDLTWEQTQDLFRTDVEGWNRREQASDFATARENFYSRVPFSKWQLHERAPIYGFESWGNLLHPPVKQIDGPLTQYHPLMEDFDRTADHPYFQPEFQRNIDQLTDTRLTRGNEIKILENTTSYQEKLALIGRAEKFLWVNLMVHFCDSSSDKLIDAMIERKRAGVEVRIIVEGLWTRLATPHCLRKMRGNGLDVVLNKDSIRPSSFTALQHSKWWIRDGVEAIQGGQNIINSENLGDGFNVYNRDTDALVKGPVVTDLMANYVQIWRRSFNPRINYPIHAYIPYIEERVKNETAQNLRGDYVYDVALRDPSLRMKGVCRMMVQGPNAATQPITPALEEHMKAAQRHIYVTTPGIDIKKELTGRRNKAERLVKTWLQKAREGVRVDVLTNGFSGGEGELTYWTRLISEWAGRRNIRFLQSLAQKVLHLEGKGAGRKNWLKLTWMHNQSENVHGWQYMRYTHQKVHFFDRIVTGIGSYNIDFHSSSKSNESEMLCMDESLAAQADRMMVRDISNAAPAVASNANAFRQLDWENPADGAWNAAAEAR